MKSKSQSALEYMMTYGWAILIIVIVAGVLYSLGIFNPTTSAGNTVTGFGGLGSVQAQCLANQGLLLYLGNSVGYTIHISRLNYTGNGFTSNINTSVTIPAGQSNTFLIPNVCPSGAASRYAVRLAFTYTEPGQTFSATQFSSGAVSGSTATSGHRTQINITSSAQTATPFQQIVTFPGVNYANLSQITQTGISLANVFFTYPNGTLIPSWIEANNLSTPIVNGIGAPSGKLINMSTNNALKPTSDLTISAWIYMTAFPNTNTALVIAEDHGGGTGGSGYSFNFYGTALYLSFDRTATRYSFSIIAPSDGLNLNQWNFVAAAYDAGTGRFNIYINGKEFNCSCASGGTSLEYNASSYFVVGSGNSAMNMSVADEQFYNTELTPQNLNQLYLEGYHGKPIAGVGNEGWWPFNGTLKDFSGTGANGVALNLATLYNSTVWLKFSGGLPSGKTTVYMNFIPISDNALNSQNIGEAPQLSSTYGQYDDGADVFNAYNNFTGPSEPTGWTQVSNATTATISDGYSARLGHSQYSYSITTATYTYPLIIEADVLYFAISSGTPGPVSIGETTNNSRGLTSASAYLPGGNGYAFAQSKINGTSNLYNANGHDVGLSGTGGTAAINTTSGVDGLAWSATGAESSYYNYNQIASASNAADTIGNYYLWVGSDTGGGGIDSVSYQWIRARAYPPSGLMPTVVMGT